MRIMIVKKVRGKMGYNKVPEGIDFSTDDFKTGKLY